jgi:hypothetical protein
MTKLIRAFLLGPGVGTQQRHACQVIAKIGAPAWPTAISRILNARTNARTKGDAIELLDEWGMLRGHPSRAYRLYVQLPAKAMTDNPRDLIVGLACRWR